ncbi:MAG: hypothetical protein QXG73_01895, partial [Candidatus Micrarchaeaceae archaeon]
MTDNENTETEGEEIKLSIKDKIKAQAMMAKMGLKITKDQADAAADGIRQMAHIVNLSKEANSYVYAKNNSIKPDADFPKAFETLKQAKTELKAMIQGAAQMNSVFPSLSRQLIKTLRGKYVKLCEQDIILHTLEAGAEPEEAEVKARAEAMAEAEVD